jgi:hypothetical protein
MVVGTSVDGKTSVNGVSMKLICEIRMESNELKTKKLYEFIRNYDLFEMEYIYIQIHTKSFVLN